MKSGLIITFVAVFIATSFFNCKKGDSPSSPAGSLFELKDPKSTGIDFTNAIVQTHQSNISHNTNLFNGGGVAVIDVNNDELPDLYFSSSSKANKLYLNLGNFKFKDISKEAGIEAPSGFKTGVTVVDINADGWQDLYVCRASSIKDDNRRNLLFVNNGDNTFTERAREYQLDDISASNHACFFDMDLDGDLDMYLLNHPSDFSTVNKVRAMEVSGKWMRDSRVDNDLDLHRLYENTSNGKFVDITKVAGIPNRGFGLAINTTYFNEDLYPDIYVSNDFVDPDMLFINNGDKTFRNIQTESMGHTSRHTMGTQLEDFNNDGLVDLFSVDMIAEDNHRQKQLFNVMQQTLLKQLTLHGYPRQVQRNVLQLNNGNQTFSEIACMANVFDTDWSWAALIMDYDLDGWKDLYVCNGYKMDVGDNEFKFFILDSIMQKGGVTEKTYPDINDFLKLMPSKELPNYVFKNNGDLTFTKMTKKWGMDLPSFSNGAAFADLDLDGDMDLVTNNFDKPAFVFENKAIQQQKGSWLQIKFKGAPANPLAYGARAKIYYDSQVQYSELTPNKGFYSSVELLLHFGLGAHKTVDKVEIIWPDGKMQTLANVPTNQRLKVNYADATETFDPKSYHVLREDIFTKMPATTGISFVHKESDYDDFDNDRLLPRRHSNLGPAIAKGDVNGDGLEDFYIGGAKGQSGALYVQSKNGNFKLSASMQGTNPLIEELGAVLFDADNDKDSDLYIVSGGTEDFFESNLYQDQLFLNDGKGNFTLRNDLIPAERQSGSTVSAFDYDKDGDLDLFVGGRIAPHHYPYTSKSFVLQNNGGKFTDVTKTVFPDFEPIGMVTDLAWADLDKNGVEEIIVAGEWMPIQVFSFDGKAFQKAAFVKGLENTDGWWNCLEAGDVDGDGDADFIGGNWGLNTRFQPSVEHPLYVYAKDFDNNGQIDPIIAYWNDGAYYPAHQRDVIVSQIPSLKKKFIRYPAYTVATIFDVYPKEVMESGVVKKAGMLASMWFENDGKGNFTAHQLPNETQVSPVKDVMIFDFNHDGQNDVLLVGNEYGPEPETGWCDAGIGVLMLGDGKSGFTVTKNRETGLWANKDARDAEVVRLPNGKNLLLVANNNDAVQGFVFK